MMVLARSRKRIARIWERRTDVKEITPISFTIQITSVEHATWQGNIISGGETFPFQSELQMLKQLRQIYPELFPEHK